MNFEINNSSLSLELEDSVNSAGDPYIEKVTSIVKKHNTTLTGEQKPYGQARLLLPKECIGKVAIFFAMEQPEEKQRRTEIPHNENGEGQFGKRKYEVDLNRPQILVTSPGEICINGETISHYGYQFVTVIAQRIKTKYYAGMVYLHPEWGGKKVRGYILKQ